MFPFIVRTGCTSTIISSRHLLCASHCYGFYALRAYPTPNDGDDDNIGKHGHKIKFYFPLNVSAHFHDIVVLEYPEGTNFTEISKPVKLAKDYIEKEGDEAYIAGFGLWWENAYKGISWELAVMGGTETSGGSDVLRHTKVTIVKNDCFGTFKVCGGNATHRALYGDSGGPMLIQRNNQWYQIGVSSESGIVGDIRTRISSFCNFIEEVTKNEAKCESIFPEKNNINFPIKSFEPIYKGPSTSKELFNFVVPLYNYYYNQGCTATVISKRHLLTSAFCVYRDWWAQSKMIQFTEHSTYKTVIGKLFPDFRTKNVVHSNFTNEPINVTAYFPLNYVWPWLHDIAVIEYSENTDFGIEPVSLAKDYFSIYLDNSTFILAGFGLGLSDIKIKNENLSRSEGAPMLYEINGKFYQIGINYHSSTPNGSRTSVEGDCEFIEEVTKNEVKCESVEPIYIYPTTLKTTVLPKKYNTVFPNQHIDSKSSSMASKIEFYFILLIITLIMLFI
uniref:Peptidase S1 domain-containing protein n=1 Tax=Panagrolaimus davidi TaxID=227884 RepID=A0A914Q183_9BILA